MKYLTRDEVVSAIAAEPDPRRAAFLSFLWRTGCRVSEALAVRAEHLDTHANVVRLTTLKQRTWKVRRVPLPPDVIASLASLGTGSLFPWSRTTAWRYVREALERVGVDSERAHPHAFRHGHGVHAALAGVPLPALQRQLGHASLTTTGVYLELSGEEIRRGYAGVSW